MLAVVDAGLVANGAVVAFVAANGYLVGLAARGRLAAAGGVGAAIMLTYMAVALVLGFGFHRFLAADWTAFAVGVLYAGPNDRPFDDGAHLIALVRRPARPSMYVAGGALYGAIGIGIAAVDAWWAPQLALVGALGVAFVLNYPLHFLRERRGRTNAATTGMPAERGAAPPRPLPVVSKTTVPLIAPIAVPSAERTTDPHAPSAASATHGGATCPHCGRVVPAANKAGNAYVRCPHCRRSLKPAA